MGSLRAKVIRYILFFVVLAGTVYFLYVVRDVVLSFLIGGLVAYFLYRPVRFFENRGLKRVWAIAAVYLVFLGSIATILWFAIPDLAKQLGDVGEMFPAYADQAQRIAEQMDGVNLPGKLDAIVQENTAKIEDYLYKGLKGFVSGVYIFLSKILIVIFAPILAFYILKDWEEIRDAFLKILSPSIRSDLTLIATDIDRVLVEFFKGHMLVLFIVGILTGVAALIIGIKFALLIGIIAGITNLIPYFGPFLGGIPAVALAFSQSSKSAIYMTLSILVIQQLESNIITPKIIGDRLGMHPLLIVFALLAGGKILGIWGMLFAVPITAALKIILSFAYLKLIEQ
ncbi:MAG: AI-2E family transporter [Bacillota bacterium]|nr:AI-2E family transporter [Bacillota bacterium]